MSTTEQFLDYLRHDRRRSEATLTRYGHVLATLAVHLGRDPIDADESEVEGWYATTRPHMPATRANALSAVRSYYTWACRWDLRVTMPTRRLDAPPVDNKLPRPIGSSDLQRILGPLTVERPDIRRAVALGAYAGLRVHEVAGLDWSSVDLDARRMRVRGKGRKERPIAISPILYDYIAPAGDGPVIGVTSTSATLQRRVNRFLADNGIGHTFHDLRKRGASMALSRGASAPAVLKMFGWSSMDTVQHYAAVDDEELDRVASLMV